MKRRALQAVKKPCIQDQAYAWRYLARGLLASCTECCISSESHCCIPFINPDSNQCPLSQCFGLEQRPV
eukprot:s1781_g11.t3